MIAADVFVAGHLVGHVERIDGGATKFSYNEGATRAVATTLPLNQGPFISHGGALPPFFANLLPEGRRLSTLRKTAKASLDDELSLLLQVGHDTIGDVAVVKPGTTPTFSEATIDLRAELDFTAALTEAGVADPVAVPGVQDKASARTIAAPVSNRESKFILKVSPPEYPKLVENEAACFALANRAGKSFPLAETQVLQDRTGRSGLLVTRFDRDCNQRFHVEDAAQLLGLYPAEKYSPPMEEVALAMMRVSAAPQLTARSIAFQVAFAWLTGNGDLHAKNLSLMWQRGRARVTPIYDIPSTLVYGDTTLALSVQGRRENLSGKKFRAFCAEIGLSARATEAVMRLALDITSSAAHMLIDATAPDPRRSRDLTRILAHRRKLWEG